MVTTTNVSDIRAVNTAWRGCLMPPAPSCEPARSAWLADSDQFIPDGGGPPHRLYDVTSWTRTGSITWAALGQLSATVSTQTGGAPLIYARRARSIWS